MPAPQSLLDLRRELRALDRLDSETEDYLKIKETYQSLLAGVQVMIGTTSGAELFFRGRKNPSKRPAHVSDLGPPPVDTVMGFQRCNPPGISMLYTSSRRITALKECRVRPGDVVYLSQWIGTDYLPVNKLLDNDEDEAFLAQLDGYSHVLHTHIDALFTRRVHDDYSNDYKQSAALSELLTSNFPDTDGLVGLRYPSVFDKAGSYNTAFPSPFAQGRVRVTHVTEILVGQPDGSPMPVRILDTAVEFPGGVIKWTGKPSLIPAPRDNGSVLFRSTGTEWVIGVREDQPSDSDIRAFLQE